MLLDHRQRILHASSQPQLRKTGLMLRRGLFHAFEMRWVEPTAVVRSHALPAAPQSLPPATLTDAAPRLASWEHMPVIIPESLQKHSDALQDVVGDEAAFCALTIGDLGRRGIKGVAERRAVHNLALAMRAGRKPSLPRPPAAAGALDLQQQNELIDLDLGGDGGLDLLQHVRLGLLLCVQGPLFETYAPLHHNAAPAALCRRWDLRSSCHP
jgi:hypothetical protein